MTRIDRTKPFAALFAVLMITSVFAGSLAFAGTAAAAPEDVVYRVNAGGDTVAASSGPDWAGATSSSPYVNGGSTYNQYSGTVGLDSSVPSGTPTDVFATELYGDQQWTFDQNVQSGQKYEVRLYFAEIFHGVNDDNGEGARVFDVAVEGQQVLNDYDIYADVGAETGVMKSYTVTPTDGTIDVDLTTETDNAKLSAVEIVEATPEPNTLGGTNQVDFGSALTGESETQTVTVTNLGADGDADIEIEDASVSGTDASEFSAGSASQTTLAPGESADVPVTFSPSSVAPVSATLSIEHSGSNSPLTVALSGEGASAVDPSFSKSTLQGFSASNPTAIDFGPDGRAYVSTQGGTVYALDVERTGENSYEVANAVQIDAINDIPNHDDMGNVESGQDNRQITGLTVAGTADQPVVYVSSSDPEISVGQDDDTTDTNSGAISRLTITPGSDGELQTSEVDHEVLVFGLPRSEENHATNGLDLSADGETLYVAQGGHTNKGAPSDNFGHTPEYALSAAILEIDLAQIENDHQAKNLQNYDSSYPNLDFYYGIPTIQNDDGTAGDDLPFGGNDGMNQAKLVEGGPVQIYSPGYRNPYDLVVTESGQIYAADHGPNGGWGGQPADADGTTVADASSVTNHPNEEGSFSKNDELVKVDEGDYGGHAAPIRANPTGADIYGANGEMVFDITESNSPVPASMVNPAEADYIPPTSGSPDPGASAGSANTMEDQNGDKVLFGPTGGTTEYTASNFGGAMQGDLLQVELGGDIERVELSADGETVTNVETLANTGGPLGITAQDDDEEFAGTVWTADHGGDGVTVFEPVDYGDSTGGSGDQCTAADDPSLDEDGDGYDNADEIDAGTDPCSAASTPADFDGDGTSNVNDDDDDNDGLDDTEDPFAVDPNNGVDTTLPVQHDLSELGLFGEGGQGWTGLMTNGENYQDLYDTSQMTVGGAAEVLTVEGVPEGDAHAGTNTQQYAFQFGVDPSQEEPYVAHTTIESFPSETGEYQSQGLYFGTGDQDNYVKLTATGFTSADASTSGVQMAEETDGSFASVAHPAAPTAGNTTDLYLRVYPSNDTVVGYYAVGDGEQTKVGQTTVPSSWFDTSDGVAPAVGVIATSNGPAPPFDATWSQISVEYLNPPANQPPTADAGADQTVDEGSTVTLNAAGSDDPDGDHLGYTWTQTAGPDVDLSVNDGTQTTFTAPEVDSETTLTFQVSVSDGSDSATDTVNVTVQDTDTGGSDTLSVAEAVASSGDGDDSTVSQMEVLTAIDWWQNDAEVPNTGGETIGLSQVVHLIDLWATGQTVGDGGDQDQSATGSALVEITPDSGNIDQSTYGGDSFQVTNTGEKNITSVSFDLSTATLPDMVFDPQGTAGDPTGEGLNIASEGGTGITTEPGTGEAFSQPHNGQNADDGYDVMTVEFDDFQNGETATFWADNDPTSIKGATISSQEAGPVSGLELARSTVTVTYEDGSTQTTQLMGDGSVGGATAVVNGSEAPAPTIGAQGVSLDAGVLDDYHSGATVSEADQTVTVAGQPGETVTLVQVEGERSLSNVPDGGYDVEELEANNAVNVEYYSVTLDSNGEAEIPVTLTSSADDSDEAGYNYFVAAHGEVSGDTGLASNVVVLKYDESAADGDTGGSGEAVFAVNAGGSAYTATDGTVYQADTNFDGGQTFTTGNSDTPSDPEIANTQDDELYHTERYGDFSYDVPVENGEYEVELAFAELYQGVATDGGEGDRVFDASIEGQQVLDGYDIYATAGGAHSAVTETFTVEVTDGQLDVAFSTVEDNAKVSAIKVTRADDGSDDGSGADDGSDDGSDATGSAEFAVTADSGIDASTYSSNTFEVTNTGEKQISSVTFDVSESLVPDAVFDPDGTAGDAVAKELSVDSQSGDGVGVVSTADGDVFSQPHNGADNAEGYDVMSIDFDDFESGESVSFSIDMDPTTIKGVSGSGGAGSISGLEIVASSVTVEYADGSTQTTDLASDGSAGGAQATAKADVPDAPTLGVQSVNLQGTDFPGHSAAAVGDTTQTLTISGPADATVQLTHVVGSEGPSDGYDIDQFEIDNAESVDTQSVALDSSGQATVEVSLSESNLDYFVTAVEDGAGETGRTSDVVVLEYDQTAGDDSTDSSTQQVLHRVNAGGDTVSATDDGPDWTGVTDTDSQYFVSVGSDAGNYYSGADVTADGTVPSSTPDAVFDSERYGNMTWEFSADAGQAVEVRLYLANSYPGSSDPGDRQFNVSVEGTQVLTNYDPVADVGHATGTMKSFTATDDGDGTITVTFETGAAENPEVRAIEILGTEGGSE